MQSAPNVPVTINVGYITQVSTEPVERSVNLASSLNLEKDSPVFTKRVPTHPYAIALSVVPSIRTFPLGVDEIKY